MTYIINFFRIVLGGLGIFCTIISAIFIFSKNPNFKISLLYFIIGSVLFIFSIGKKFRWKYFFIPFNMCIFFILAVKLIPGMDREKITPIVVVMVIIGSFTYRVLIRDDVSVQIQNPDDL